MQRPAGDPTADVAAHRALRGLGSAVCGPRGTRPQGNRCREYRNIAHLPGCRSPPVEELEAAVADFMAWSSVHDERGEDGLNPDPNQEGPARTKRDDADRAVELRMAEAYQDVLAPAQPVHDDFLCKSARSPGLEVPRGRAG